MNKKLVYKFVKTLDYESRITNTNFLCKDNYIHVRLRRFGHEKEHISGFESKLTFLLTYLMGIAVNQHITTTQAKLSKDKENYQELWESCLECLKSTKAYEDIDYLFSLQFSNYKGLKILPMYSLKYKPENAYDLLGECYDFTSVDLSSLLRCQIKDNLYNFLFDNNLEIYIENKYNIDEKKFIKKHSKKKKESYINLWADCNVEVNQ